MSDKNKKTKDKKPNGGISDEANFYVDAQEFLKSQLPHDFKSNMREFVKSKGYTENEVRLFRAMMQESIGLEAVILILEGQLSKHKK